MVKVSERLIDTAEWYDQWLDIIKYCTLKRHCCFASGWTKPLGTLVVHWILFWFTTYNFNSYFCDQIQFLQGLCLCLKPRIKSMIAITAIPWMVSDHITLASFRRWGSWRSWVAELEQKNGCHDGSAVGQLFQWSSHRPTTVTAICMTYDIWKIW